MFVTIPSEKFYILDSDRQIIQMVENCDGFIAGGYLRTIYQGEGSSDMDIFCKHTEAYDVIKNHLVIQLGFSLLFENAMLSRFTHVEGSIVDLIQPRRAEWMQTVGPPIEVISHFDFTVCRIFMQSGSIIADERFEQDCKDKILHIEHIVCPVSQIKRIAKYAIKGYKINSAEIGKIYEAWESRSANERTFLLSTLKDIREGAEVTMDDVEQLRQLLYID